MRCGVSTFFISHNQTMHFELKVKVKVKSLSSVRTLCNPVDCSPPGSSIHGILQARILEWTAIPFSRGSSWLRDQTRVSCFAGRFFTIWTTMGRGRCHFEDTESRNRPKLGVWERQDSYFSNLNERLDVACMISSHSGKIYYLNLQNEHIIKHI